MRHELVRAVLVHYLERAGAAPRARVFTKPANVERAMRHCTSSKHRITTDDRRQMRVGWALAWPMKSAPPRIYVNLAKHATVDDLLNSGAHEAVHLRWPSLCHGAVFDRRVRALLGGYTCTARGQRLPEAFR